MNSLFTETEIENMTSSKFQSKVSPITKFTYVGTLDVDAVKFVSGSEGQVKSIEEHTVGVKPKATSNYITINKLYYVEAQDDLNYIIVDDNGVTKAYLKTLFNDYFGVETRYSKTLFYYEDINNPIKITRLDVV